MKTTLSAVSVSTFFFFLIRSIGPTNALQPEEGGDYGWGKEICVGRDGMYEGIQEILKDNDKSNNFTYDVIDSHHSYANGVCVHGAGTDLC